MLYVCSHNGATGVVRAEDYDDEVRRVRKIFRKKQWDRRFEGQETRAVRPIVVPVFLFSDKDRGPETYKNGSLADLANLLEGCYVEERSFELPRMDSPGFPRGDYWPEPSNFPYEDNYRRWGFERAQNYLHNKAIYTWGH
jgi:hypothetical protein